MHDTNVFDIFIVGGGINGAGIAADAAGRGLSVALAEAADLAGATSSASSKLIHGGLRYLEHFEFRLVREALAEREVLLAKAPHLIWPLRFVLPHAGVRPRWMVGAGLLLYDHLARRRNLPRSRGIDLAIDPAGRPLKAEFDKAFAYWDCWVDDARLVVANAMAARQKGALILTRTRVMACRADVETGLWQIDVADGSVRRTLSARTLVNAAGPWVDDIDRLSASPGRVPNRGRARLIQGSHLVVPRIAGAEDAYLLQSTDKRVVFALPFERSFSLIGTTDVPFDGDPTATTASDAEENYLLALANRFFRTELKGGDVVWRYAGVRSLYDDANGDPSAVTRDYRLEIVSEAGGPPRLSIYGGKITTYRRLAEEAVARLVPYLNTPATPSIGPAWTASSTLPGGDIAGAAFQPFLAEVFGRYPAFLRGDLEALARRHGSAIDRVLGDARSPADLGRAFGFGLFEREVAYLKAEEWVSTPDDILWRRSKIGLHARAAGGEAERRLADDLASVL